MSKSPKLSLRALLVQTYHAIRWDWLDAVLVLLTYGLALKGFWIGSDSWPLNSSGPSAEGAVLAAAYVTAFSSVILSSVVVPLTRLTQLGPGFGDELLRRWQVWLPGILLVAFTAALFWLASLPPDREAARAAGYLSAAGFGMLWLVTRSILRSSDELDIARRQSRYWRKQIERERAARLTKAGLTRLSRGDRSLEIQEQLDAQRGLLSASLMRLRHAIRASIREASPTIAAGLWNDAMLPSLIDHVVAVQTLGPYDRPVVVAFELAEEIVTAADDPVTDEVAGTIVDSFEQVLRATGYGRANLVSRIASETIKYLDVHWRSERSYVPSKCVGLLAKLGPPALLEASAHTGTEPLEALVKIAARAAEDDGAYLLGPAMHGIDACGHAVMELDDPERRRAMLEVWFVTIAPLVRIPTVRRNIAWSASPREYVLSGSMLGEASVVTVLRSHDDEAQADLVRVIGGQLKAILTVLASEGTGKGPNPALTEGLELAYNIALRAAALGVTDAVEPISTSARLALRAIPRAERRAVLLRGDVLELLWSITLADAYNEEHADAAVDLAAAVRAILSPAPNEPPPARVRSTESRDYMLGFLIMLDVPEEEILPELDRLVPEPDSFDDFGRRFRLFELGRVLPICRNRASEPLELYDQIEKRALTRWTRLNAPEDVRAGGLEAARSLEARENQDGREAGLP